MKEDMGKDIRGCVTTISIKKITCVKFKRCFRKNQVQNLVEVGRWLHNAVIFKDNHGKRFNTT